MYNITLDPAGIRVQIGPKFTIRIQILYTYVDALHCFASCHLFHARPHAI